VWQTLLCPCCNEVLNGINRWYCRMAFWPFCMTVCFCGVPILIQYISYICCPLSLKEPFQVEHVMAEATSSTKLAFCALSYENRDMRPGKWHWPGLPSWWRCPRFQLWLLENVFSTCMINLHSILLGVAIKSDLQQTSYMCQCDLAPRCRSWNFQPERAFYMCDWINHTLSK